MVTFAGVSHVAFTVTDLDASQRFDTEVVDFVVVMDVGYGRICESFRARVRVRRFLVAEAATPRERNSGHADREDGPRRELLTRGPCASGPAFSLTGTAGAHAARPG